MKSEELKSTDTAAPRTKASAVSRPKEVAASKSKETVVSKPKETVVSSPKTAPASHVVTADSVQAEEVPTIPLGSLETISALQPEVTVQPVSATRAVSMPAPLVVQPSEYRRSLGEWIQLWWDGIRPAYLPLSLLPVLLGSVLAWTHSVSSKSLLGQFHPIRFIAAIIAVLLIQTGAHLLNDYYDYLSGADTSNAFGPGGLIQQGLVKPTRVLACGFTLLGLGALVGLLAATMGGFLVVVLGLIGLLCAYFYSATAHSLSALGLGELVGFVVFGPLITLGAYAEQAQSITPGVVIYSLPLGLLAAAIIHVNNMRDSEGDAHADKHTIASLLGLQWSRAWFLVLLLGAYAVVTALALPHGAPHLLLLTLWTLPPLVVVVSGVLRTDTRAGLHLVMVQMLKLETYFVIFLVIALILSALFPVLPHLPAHILPI